MKTATEQELEDIVRDDAVMAEIAAERYRQRHILGHDSHHDDTHRTGELANAAAVYANPLYDAGWPWPDSDYPNMSDRYPSAPGRRRQLVKAAALIVAELARLDRAAGQ